MMDSISFLTGIGAELILTLALSGESPGSDVFHLNSSSIPVAPSDSTTATYTEPTVGGYAPQFANYSSFSRVAGVDGSATATLNIDIVWTIAPFTGPEPTIYSWWMDFVEPSGYPVFGANLASPIVLPNAGTTVYLTEVTLVLGQCTSPPPPSGTPWILTESGGTAVAQGTFNFGLEFTVGSAPMTVTALGRWTYAGNSQNHTITIYDLTYDIVAQIVVESAAGGANTFQYVTLPTPAVLLAGNTYYLIDGDGTSNTDTVLYQPLTITTTSDAAATAACYVHGIPSPTNTLTLVGSSPNDGYVVPNFEYHL
jgi:hypothetical protein